MTNSATTANRLHLSSAETQQATPNAKSLKYIAHGIYLQLLVGAAILATAAFDVAPELLFSGPKACGVLLIGFAINSLIYIHRYKKSLHHDAANR